MSNHTVPAAAEGVPAINARRSILVSPSNAALAALIADPVLAAIPTWMQLKIEAHREANAALNRARRELEALEDASTVIDRDNPPWWLLEAEQAVDHAADWEKAALKALLAERPRNLKDAQDRACYLVSARIFGGQGSMIATLLSSMTGGEA
ncbi:hypothetical protein [Antarcticirhabdus aurantiaca]|uniref:Uncharacterized protein n=1 Tax=Antarcticirhabdus aurantiaca TaxID=2606717 RepID=A0ACD4NKN4_9HYPH|nr:hypothetical protein [Antarcticirhabdus aurantiaca]WAJ27399.1 hypothetical protein OXU80_21515 [Jeongeuplla avenae]